MVLRGGELAGKLEDQKGPEGQSEGWRLEGQGGQEGDVRSGKSEGAGMSTGAGVSGIMLGVTSVSFDHDSFPVEKLS